MHSNWLFGLSPFFLSSCYSFVLCTRTTKRSQCFHTAEG